MNSSSGGSPVHATIPETLEEIAQGRLVILVDDEQRENEGDLVCAAEKVTPEIVNFMARHGRGLVCLTLTPEKCQALDLHPQAQENTAPLGTAFMVSVDARRGVTTGISAADRAHTILTAMRDDCRPEDLVRPGHVFPVCARRGGVLVRAGQTEGSVDLARLAGLRPAGVICEIMNEDGTMARMPELERFAAAHGLKIATIADLIEHRAHNETLVRPLTDVDFPTRYGHFRLWLFTSEVTDRRHLALVMGDLHPGKTQSEPVLVRVHSECLTGDALGSLRCDCGEQYAAAMRLVAEAGKGVVLYMRQEGRGIGLVNKLRAYELQDGGADTVEANELLGFKPDLRDYGLGAQMLAALGLRQLRLITNNPRKVVGLKGHGLSIVEQVPLVMPSRPENEFYLKTKAQKLGHLLGGEKDV